MNTKSDYQRYLDWAGIPADALAHIDKPKEFDPWFCPYPLRDILDHGQVIGGVCCIPIKHGLNLPDTFECGILSRTYATAEQIDNPLPGLLHVRLPYDCEAGTPVLTLIVGEGAGADAVLQGADGLGRDLHHLLPRSMVATHHVAIHQRSMKWTPDVRLALN